MLLSVCIKGTDQKPELPKSDKNRVVKSKKTSAKRGAMQLPKNSIFHAPVETYNLRNTYALNCQ